MNREGNDEQSLTPHPKTVVVLETVLKSEEETSTRQITSREGIEGSTVGYHAEKLQDHGIIEIEKPDEVGEPKVYTITDSDLAERQLERMKSELGDDVTVHDDLEDRVDALENRINSLDQGGTARERNLERRVNRLEDRAENLWQGFVAIREYLRQEQEVTAENLAEYYADGKERVED
jgi:DNA-binding transcriptional ArsR family regulator